MNLTNYLNLNSWLPLKVFWLSELPSLFLMAFSNWRCSKNCRKRKILVSIWMDPDETLAPQRNECFAYSPSAGPGCITLPGSIPMPIQLIFLLCLLQSCTAHESQSQAIWKPLFWVAGAKSFHTHEMCTSFSQRVFGDLVLLLEQAKTRKWGESSLHFPSLWGRSQTSPLICAKVRNLTTDSS